MKNWKSSELHFIKQNLDSYSDKDFAAMYGVSVKAISSMRNRYGVMRPKYQWSFRKGGKPWNKGISFNAGGRSVETRFKKRNAA